MLMVGEFVWAGEGEIWEICYLPLNFDVDLKLLLKNNNKKLK